MLIKCGSSVVYVAIACHDIVACNIVEVEVCWPQPYNNCVLLISLAVGNYTCLKQGLMDSYGQEGHVLINAG